MKTLNITLTVLANTLNDAENRGKMELMELVKIIGMRSGSNIASCSGDTDHLDNDKYEVNAKVQIDGCGDVTEIIKEAQHRWNNKFDILSSSIFVEEQKSEPVQKPRDYESVSCDSCGQMMVKGYENVINPGTDEEYCLCERCFTDTCNDGEVVYCEYCDHYIDCDSFVLNPVTGKNNLCPCCGNTPT